MRPWLPGYLILATLACGGAGGSSAGTADVSQSVALLGFDVDATTVTLRFDPSAVGGTWHIEQDGDVIDVPVAKATVAIPGDLPEATFSPLVPGAATWRLTAKDGSETTGTLTIGERFTHFFAAPEASVVGLPAHVAVGATVSVSGTTGGGGSKKEAFIGRPSGAVERVSLGDFPLPPSTAFALDVVASEAGLLVVELSRNDGIPAAVLPVYVGDAVPLARSPLDAGFTSSKTLDSQAASQEILTLVNALRSDLGLAEVKAHSTLAATATEKADIIAQSKILSHTSPDGEDAATRAGKAGLTGQVWENLAVEYTPERAYLGWYWSPNHREALVSDKWRSHGLAVGVMDAVAGQFVFVQHLSTEEAP